MARRDRHEHGLRRPLLPYDAPAYRTRSEVFDDEVREAAERLEQRWGRAWGRIDFASEDVPASDPTPWEEGIPLGRVFPADMGQPTRVVLYRRPIELRVEAGDVRALVRDVLAEQVGGVLGRTPEEIDPDYGSGA